jgi:hypothetical protein
MNKSTTSRTRSRSSGTAAHTSRPYKLFSTNYLPDKVRHWYQPDVVLKSLTEPNDVRYIIEVECDPVRKAIVGACLLADCSVEEMQDAAAGLIFIIYSEKGNEQIDDFKNKVEIIRDRCPHLSSIQIVTDEEFKQGKGFETRSTGKKKDAFSNLAR